MTIWLKKSVKDFKKNHATQEYTIVINKEPSLQTFKIHPVGDVNGDGKVNTIDVARANAHAKGVSLLNDYGIVCADINRDGKVNTIDVARMNAHAKNVSSLY